jgi:NAD dependent epimerase/dehydratase family enzyme
MRIIIPGSGQIGRILARHFHSKDHTVIVLSRCPHAAPWRTMMWDGRTPGAWVPELEHADVCINLAGRSVNCRYHPQNRHAIEESRVRSTLLLNQVIASMKQPPRL